MRKEQAAFTLEEPVKNNEKIIWDMRKSWTENLGQNILSFLKNTRYIAPKNRRLAEEMRDILFGINNADDMERKAKAQLTAIQKAIPERGWDRKPSFLYHLCRYTDGQIKINNYITNKILAREDHYRLKYEEANKNLTIEKTDLTGKVQASDQEIMTLRTSNRQQTQHILKLQEQINFLEQNKQQLIRQLKTKDETLEQVMGENRIYSEQIVQLNISKNAIEREKKEFETKSSNLQAEIDQIKTPKKVETVNVIPQNVKQNRKLRDTQEQLRLTEEKLKLYDGNKIETLVSENEQFKLEITRLKDESVKDKLLIKNQTKQIDELETKCSSQADDLLNLVTQAEQSKKELDSVKEKNTELTKLVKKFKEWIHNVFGQFGHKTKEETCDLIEKNKYTFTDYQIECIKWIAISSRINLSHQQIKEYVEDAKQKVKLEAFRNRPQTLEDQADKWMDKTGEAISDGIQSFKSRWFSGNK